MSICRVTGAEEHVGLGCCDRPYPCIESTLDVTAADKTVRLWIDQRRVPTILPAYRDVVADVKREVMRLLPPAFFEWLKLRVPYLSAAQLIRTDPKDPGVRVGVVVYYVDFVGDPHG